VERHIITGLGWSEIFNKFLMPGQGGYVQKLILDEAK
jgi:hypothetical protein